MREAFSIHSRFLVHFVLCNFTFLKSPGAFCYIMLIISDRSISTMYMLGGAHTSQDNDKSRCDVQVHIKEHTIRCHGFTKSNRWDWILCT